MKTKLMFVLGFCVAISAGLLRPSTASAVSCEQLCDLMFKQCQTEGHTALFCINEKKACLRECDL